MSANTKGKKVGRPRKESEVRITRSIRITPSHKELIEAKYETIQKWFDTKFDEEFGQVHEAEVTKRAEAVSIDDF